ncbi:hypothetical protein AA313_de0208107 [Arthrobotrys entomopaga]|nr:hypothetical protein AA313_de0208107 [Arthrobotrys entomopaga]
MAPSRTVPRTAGGGSGAQDEARSDHDFPKPFNQTPADKRRPVVAGPVLTAPSSQSQAHPQHQNQNQLHPHQHPQTLHHHQQQLLQHEGTEGIAWDRMPISLLQEYRSANLLRTPSASTQYSATVLSAGIGKKSASHRHRQPQDSLLSAVRRHFNNQAINEHDVIVNFLYTVKNHGPCHLVLRM